MIAAAQAHADAGGLAIDYRVGGIEAVAGERFDLVTSLEVIEHVADRARSSRGLAGALAPGGLLLLSTPNRTPLSRLALIGAGGGHGPHPARHARLEQVPDARRADRACWPTPA